MKKSIDIFQDYSSLFIVLQNEKQIQTRRQNEQKKNKRFVKFKYRLQKIISSSC